MLVYFVLILFSAVHVNGRDASMGKEIALLPPASADEIDVKFYLLSRAESSFFTVNDSIHLLKALPLNPSFRTIILIHGWLDTMDAARFWWHPILETTRMFNAKVASPNNHHEYQVMFVDWSRGSSSSYYLPAVSNLRVTAQVVADMILRLVDELNFEASHIRLIGFSLGAHVAGFTGKLLKGKYRLGWITGLEPANAMFELSSPSGSIYKTDARYVDIVHTSSGSVLEGFSKVGPLGCSDFYINGASARRQSGCEEDMPFGAIGGFFSKRRPCAHDRSPLLFSTLKSQDDCQNIGFACSSYESFLAGNCASCGQNQEDCRVFGFHDEVVTDNWPSVYHYIMTLKTTIMETEAAGSVFVGAVTEGQRMEMTFRSNQEHKMLIALPHPLDLMRELSLYWDARRDIIDRLLGPEDADILGVRSLTFSYISHLNET